MTWLPQFMYPGPLYVMAAMLAGLALDFAYPYHSGLALALHPVHTSYVMSQRLYRPRGSRLRGAAIWAITMGVHLAAYGALLYAAWLVSPWLWVAAASLVFKLSASLRLLLDTVRDVGESLARGDLGAARAACQGIVRRDLRGEDAGHVASAAVESLAESLVDGFASPLFWLLLLGPLGALAQRVANTLDGSLGFLDEEHRDVGFVSAWADTVINYVPARLTALLISLASAVLGPGRVARSLRAWAACHSATQSRNAGHPISSMAGALGVSLEKRGHYTVCPGMPLPTHAEVLDSVKVAAAASAIAVGGAAAVLALLAALA